MYANYGGNYVTDFSGITSSTPANLLSPQALPTTRRPLSLPSPRSNNSTNLGLNTTVTLTFSKPLNPSTVNNGTFNLFNGTARLNPSVSLSSDYQVVTMSHGPAEQRHYYGGCDHGVQDLAGNALTDFSSTSPPFS